MSKEERRAVQDKQCADKGMPYANPSTSPPGRSEIMVVLVDSRPAYEARNFLKLLCSKGIHRTYVLLAAIGPILRTVNSVFLGAHAMLANGAIYGRAGAAMIARVMLDSILSNKISMSQSNIPPGSYHHLFKLLSTLPTAPQENK
ncbi:hypothetical protein PtA15_4A80 [Puccinia triticina]|uniref:Translation initiation factor eIF2B subunit delta n=1 Tax=Puccinia triticina TaxID=208348 RepID=A0ABY7CGP8_9BASI|nr:uncharacterized protein PtA15_4A80 [Puccinia triticina]WAQ83632.1 hypothetical protein PtA15_4A80 [Puccinia triticina]WAR54468.1 hypothetical protein PtB15_4B85 [Puccinia triticina]